MAGKKKLPHTDEPEESLHDVLVRMDDDDDDSLRELDPRRYLDEDTQGDPVFTVLAPPDLSRCQCEWRDTTLDTFGPKPVVRCEEEPTVVAFQKRDPDSVRPTGVLSLCDVHHVLVEHLYPGQCYYRRITSDKKIGDFA